MPRFIIQASNHPEKADVMIGPVELSTSDFQKLILDLGIDGFQEVQNHRVDVICDFCSGTPVVWKYQIRPGGIIGQNLIVDGHGAIHEETHIDTDGMWGCCEICHGLIEDEDGPRWIDLVNRAIEVHPARAEMEAAGLPRSFMQRIVSSPISCFMTGYLVDHEIERIPTVEELLG